jgi:osomolarity two-component system response regulator SKN7
MYTPIISMTSNAQPQDVDSYLQSGMNDVLAKPFTKYGLFGILEKHLIHLKAIQLSTEIPITLGIPPLSDQGVMEAVMNGVNWNVDTSNPLASMGWSDDTYQLILQVSFGFRVITQADKQEFLTSGSMPDISQLGQIGQGNGNGTANGNASIGTNVIFGDNRKRSIELIDEDWTSPATDMSGRTPQIQQAPTLVGRGNAKRMKGVGA